jgi:hypothetical protein
LQRAVQKRFSGFISLRRSKKVNQASPKPAFGLEKGFFVVPTPFTLFFLQAFMGNSAKNL